MCLEEKVRRQGEVCGPSHFSREADAGGGGDAVEPELGISSPDLGSSVTQSFSVASQESIPCACVLSHVQLFTTRGSIARQVLLSMGFSRQKY